MKKKEYQEKLFYLMTKFGYWSNEVKELNSKCLEEHGAIKYRRWHDQVIYLFKDLELWKN